MHLSLFTGCVITTPLRDRLRLTPGARCRFIPARAFSQSHIEAAFIQPDFNLREASKIYFPWLSRTLTQKQWFAPSGSSLNAIAGRQRIADRPNAPWGQVEHQTSRQTSAFFYRNHKQTVCCRPKAAGPLRANSGHSRPPSRTDLRLEGVRIGMNSRRIAQLRS